MKNRIYKLGIAVLLMAGISSACSLDEYNPTTVSLETAYKYRDGYEGLVNSCYIDLYFYYGKIDGIGAMEMGSDLWTNVANNEAGFILYSSALNNSLGTLKVIWQGLYSMVNLCNTAIYYGTEVDGYTADELRTKVAEAYFLRAWANYHLVEQFGNVVLRDKSLIETGADIEPQRSSEQAFYDLIISDLQFAVENLPVNQIEKGRVAKKAAYAMLSKAALQRTRLGESETYAKIALDAAEYLINNQQELGCALYYSDDNVSGFAKLWDGKNNKNNTEFLFIEAIDHEGALNPEGWNRGRSRQYYQTDNRTVGGPWGMLERSRLFGRANSRYFKPTKHLLTQVFDPRENTPDTRFASSFFYKYYSYNQRTITADMAQQYGKDASLVGHVILSSAAPGSDPNVMAANYYAGIGLTATNLYEGFKNLEGDASLAMYTPNWTIPTEEKAFMPYLVNDISDMFQENGKYTEHAQRKEIYPSLSKFSNITYAYTEQYHMGDIGIIRLGEIYLVAAEAALLYNGDKNKAAGFVNELRKRAAVKSREAEMVVGADVVTIDFILKERARELAGEQVRWYDLKRTGKLTREYLSATNPDIVDFDPAKHLVRPIPISFLNAIANADEFGTNGY